MGFIIRDFLNDGFIGTIQLAINVCAFYNESRWRALHDAQDIEECPDNLQTFFY